MRWCRQRSQTRLEERHTLCQYRTSHSTIDYAGTGPRLERHHTLCQYRIWQSRIDNVTVSEVELLWQYQDGIGGSDGRYYGTWHRRIEGLGPPLTDPPLELAGPPPTSNGRGCFPVTTIHYLSTGTWCTIHYLSTARDAPYTTSVLHVMHHTLHLTLAQLHTVYHTLAQYCTHTHCQYRTARSRSIGRQGHRPGVLTMLTEPTLSGTLSSIAMLTLPICLTDGVRWDAVDLWSAGL
eukprot:2912326-Rhodomonas_salina.1